MKLYKYCDDNGVDILRNQALKISKISEFNDPFEFKIAKNDNKNINEAVNELYEYQRKKYRVICFSSKCNNLILWSHYSKNHTGILITFETDLIFLNNQDTLTKYLEHVDYKKTMINIPNNYMQLRYEEKENIVKKNTYRKYLDWEYEDEYRAIFYVSASDDKKYIDIHPNSIMEVVLGLNFDLKLESDIKALLKKDEFNHVKLKKASLHNKDYKMKYLSYD